MFDSLLGAIVAWYLQATMIGTIYEHKLGESTPATIKANIGEHYKFIKLTESLLQEAYISLKNTEPLMIRYDGFLSPWINKANNFGQVENRLNSNFGTPYKEKIIAATGISAKIIKEAKTSEAGAKKLLEGTSASNIVCTMGADNVEAGKVNADNINFMYSKLQ